MPFYQSKGMIPPKRHTAFKKADGSLYYEELVSREGFSHMYTNLYHLRMPTRVLEMGDFHPIELKRGDKSHRARHIRTANINSAGNAIDARRPLFFNSDVVISKAHVNDSMDFHNRNGHFDELLYIQSGGGTLKSNLGTLKFGFGDYIVIPRGVIWQMDVDDECRILVVESNRPIETPSRYRNKFGQLLEHSPFCERDIRTPELTDPVDKEGEFLVKVRVNDGIQDMVYGHHPCDVVGWDGYFFPWIFNIDDFEPIVGSLHQPPPVHQVLQSEGFVVCNFVSRLFDFHPDAIPAPYPHSNVDSDEILFYSQGEFMSRKGIDLESITHHPMGLPHGPQPGKYEASIGKKKTKELAVMIDTFKPLDVVDAVIEIDDVDYPKSWV
ncbi:MAG: homogentisate 1,2-dioxygenase [Candidatus Marinimicrobia bacterium]|nr:homogentisate 1,2-dioxygenase [Candidatus Neomarinimicrobiota bacterium]